MKGIPVINAPFPGIRRFLFLNIHSCSSGIKSLCSATDLCIMFSLFFLIRLTFNAQRHTGKYFPPGFRNRISACFTEINRNTMSVFLGVSGLFLSWSVVLSLNMLHQLTLTEYSSRHVLTRYRPSLSRTGHSFYRQILNTESPPALPADIQLQGQLINTWFSPRRRFNNKKHTGWLMINILIINIRRYP